MSLRLICGRSGTGKSELCLNEVIENLNKENKIYIITPEQFSYSVEKKLLEKAPNGAILNAAHSPDSYYVVAQRLRKPLCVDVGGSLFAYICSF